MRGLKLLCLIAGIANILLGLFMWPAGLGTYGATTYLVGSNYRMLIKDGKVMEATPQQVGSPNYTNELFKGLETMISRDSAIWMFVLVGQGCVFVAASLVAKNPVAARQGKPQIPRDPNQCPPESTHPMR
ncbi:MAG: hypothetical protein KF678_08965 [Phycisphaeraceae bacterium]|nr:hypothetical protein [Phycisphaeraceae bacterium]